MTIYLKLFLIFSRIGIFGFGGGMAMLPLMFQGVSYFNLMTQEEFADLVAISQVTPGPIAVNAATYVGFSVSGIAGAFVATLGVAIPAFVLVNIVYEFVKKFRESTLVKGIFKGVRPATVAMIAVAAIIMGESTFIMNYTLQWIPIAMCATSIFMVGKLKLSPILVFAIMGGIGVIVCG